MPFATTWLDVEMILLSEVRQRQRYGVTYMWNLKKKNDTKELIYKTEIDSDIENKFVGTKGDSWGVGR